MRIGINASFLRKQNTGIGQVTLNFLRKLSESQVTSHKPQVLEFVLYLEEDVEIDLPENFSKKAFLPKWYKRDDLIRKIWWEKCLLPKNLKKDGCDVFLSLYQSPTVICCKKGKKIRHVMLVHDIIPKLFPEYLGNLRKKIYWKMTERGIRKADKIISVSKKTEKDLIRNLEIDPSKISVSYVAIDEIFKKPVLEKESERILKKYGLEKGYIYAGGGMEVRKNIEGTIRAYKILLDSTRDMFAKLREENIPPLVISGKLMPELAPLVTDAEGLVGSMGLGKRVKLLGFVPQEDLPALYKNALFFSFPSFYEGFGLPLLEAMSQGTPVLTSKKSSLPEVGSDAVLYCNPDDIEDVVVVMKNLLTREDLRKTLSEKSLRRADIFSWDKFAEKVLNISSEEHKKAENEERLKKQKKPFGG